MVNYEFKIHLSLYKRFKIQVWTRNKKPRMLLKQRFVTSPLNIVYTAFYSKVYKHSYNKTFQDFAENAAGVLSE